MIGYFRVNGYFPDYDPERRRRSGQLRQARLEAAREKGTHTKIEWEILQNVFSECVGCGVPYEYLNGVAPTKDHIHPIFCGGCDCIANLQPVCRQCNSSGVAGDLREASLPGWQTIYLHRLGAYF
jgi:5-methylcytosine-specific restriction endonuclease McrA